jgi:hypothetical protein
LGDEGIPKLIHKFILSEQVRVTMIQDIVLLSLYSAKMDSLPNMYNADTARGSSLPPALRFLTYHICAVGALPGHGAIGPPTQSAFAACVALMIGPGSSLAPLASDPVLGSRGLGDPTMRFRRDVRFLLLETFPFCSCSVRFARASSSFYL